MKQQVTMSEVADEAGVSPSTVSRALRNDPRISEAKRQLIHAVAERLGYRPNPMVSALMMSRRHDLEQVGIKTLALVTDYGGDEGWRDKDVCRWEFEGIARRADELGFELEEFALSDHGGDMARVEKVLRARGIRAVLLGFSRDRSRKVLLSTEGFAVAGLSAYFREAAVDRSNFHGLYNVRLALAEMQRRGYRRTGLVVPELNNRISGYLWSAGALDWMRTRTEAERVQPFIPDGDRSEDAFRRWLDQEEPDSLLVYKLPVKSWLSKLGLRIPQDIGVASLYRTEGERQSMAGIDGNLEMVGAAAVDLVVSSLGINRLGLPEHPKEVLIKGDWCEGVSIRSP